jgi:AbrB family looped-hinge helix DNA binding protein
MGNDFVLRDSAGFGGFRARVAERGQVVIPKALRDRLGIRPGDEIEFSEQGGRLVAVRVSPATGGVDRAYGLFGSPGSTDAAVDEMRGKAELPPARRGRRR